MSTRITDVSQVPYISSGTYFREVDLTVVTNATGGFSAASICLAEKGPAFEISNSSTYTDRAFRLGELNPDFPSSYYAKQYLEQAQNYKEVRLLGLEGYTDTRGFAISLAVSGSVAAVPNTSPLTVGKGGLVAVLKERPTALTGRPAISTVAVQTSTYTDPSSGLPVSEATDYQFDLLITYVDTTTDRISCSLRPESNQYIVKKLWNVVWNIGAAGQKTFPLIKTNICPLWVDYVLPSTQSRPSLSYPLGYYLPNSTVNYSTLPLLTGVTNFGTNFTYATATITNIVPKISNSVVVGTTVTVTGDITSGYFTGGQLKAVTITNVSGTGNITAANGTWGVTNLAYGGGSTTFDLNVLTGFIASPQVITPFAGITTGSTFSSSLTPIAAKYIVPTWEPQVLNLLSKYQTPITPWFVSDGDANGDFTRLFRFWSISDGTSANTETKIQIRNINPNAYNGSGSFDILIRKWDDTDDAQVVLETFPNLTMDTTLSNYVERRIGTGEDYPLQSRFIFIEMNGDLVLPSNSLPYGVLGYPNVTGMCFSDVEWTLDYDQTRPLTKQTLGLANNTINAFSKVAASDLQFRTSTNAIGIGFHLNPKNNTTFATDQSAVFQFASQNIYKDINGNALTPSAIVTRSNYVADFYGGFDGWNVYASRKWSDPTSADYAALQLGIAQLSDKENIDADFTLLVTPDFQFDTDPQACESVLEMVTARGDALYIPDLAYDTYADAQNAADLVNQSNMQSNFDAIYFPWIQIKDNINNINQWVPPSLLALGTITYVAMNENVWQPPGGAIRTVTNNLVRTRRRLVLSDREILKGASINPITLFPGSGYEITEVRTTQPVFSALSFIHNRLLLCYAKKVLNQVMRPLLFQLNNDITKDAFLATVRPIFDRIKKLNGVQEYSVNIVDHPELNDPTTIYGQITIVPLYPVERIIIDFTLTDTIVTTTDSTTTA